MPYKDVKQSNWAPSAVAVSFDDELLDSALKWPIIDTECWLLTDKWTTIFSKLVVNESNSPDDSLGDRYIETT